MTLPNKEALRALIALAEKATPGPWTQAASVNCGDVYVKHSNGAYTLADTESNAAFIAACDPQTIIGLARALQGYLDGAGLTEEECVKHLRPEFQRQIDFDGCEVAVSRQALDETLALIDRLASLRGSGERTP